MSKSVRYYKDVTHNCGCIVRYEFSISKIANKEKRAEMSQELSRMATVPCNKCEEQAKLQEWNSLASK